KSPLRARAQRVASASAGDQLVAEDVSVGAWLQMGRRYSEYYTSSRLLRQYDFRPSHTAHPCAESTLAHAIHQRDIVAHGLFLGGALEFGPGIVFCASDEIGEAWATTRDIAGRGLLVERVDLQECVVVRPSGQILRSLRRGLELGAKIGHSRSPPLLPP